jgi:hypothetical protein
VVGRSFDRQRTASASNAHPLGRTYISPFAAVGPASNFRRITSCSIALSSDRSATIFFSLPFSSSSWRSRFHLRRCQAGILLAPIVIGRLADPRLAADLAHRCAFLSLPQDERNLRLAELRSLNGPSPSSGPNQSCR